MDNKIIELAKKLHALAERGEGGEKANAEKVLRAFMAKHGITIETIIGEKRTWREFKAKGKDKQQFLIQTVASVIGDFSYKQDRETFYIELTDAEFIEIDAKYEFYWKAYKEELDLFYQAFVQKNRLWKKPSGERTQENKPLTAEEKARLLRMFQMMEGIEQKSIIKQIEA